MKIFNIDETARLDFDSLSKEKKVWVCMRLALADYSIEFHDLVMKLWNEQMVTILFESNSVIDYVHNFANGLEDIYLPLSTYLRENKTSDLITNFACYKKNVYSLGSDIRSAYLCKLYHETEPTEIEQNGFGRKWIDFSKQLIEHPSYIYDKSSLWAGTLPLSTMLEPSLLQRYGSNLMLLKPFVKEKYIILPKEVVGKRYEVLLSCNLYHRSTWNKLSEFISFDEYKLVENKLNQILY